MFASFKGGFVLLAFVDSCRSDGVILFACEAVVKLLMIDTELRY